jgi:fucose 4-O-acetylase-like acetyltransferase
VIYAHASRWFFDRPDGLVVDYAFSQGQAIASFVMALFFFISGVGSANIQRKGPLNVARMSLHLVVLAYLVHIVGLGLTFALIHIEPDPYYSQFLRDAVVSSATGTHLVPGVVWFLLSLAVVRIIVYLVAAKAPRWAFWPLVGMAALATLHGDRLPDFFAMPSWPAGVVFMLLGWRFAGLATRAPIWAAAPLAVAVWVLAPLNRGCGSTPLEACGNTLHGDFYVHLPDGLIGFAPLYYVTAAAGVVAVLGLARGMARLNVPFVAGVGRNSMNYLILHGLILETFEVVVAKAPPGPMPILAFLVMMAGFVALHGLLVPLANPALKVLRRSAGEIAEKGISGARHALARLKVRTVQGASEARNGL